MNKKKSRVFDGPDEGGSSQSEMIYRLSTDFLLIPNVLCGLTGARATPDRVSCACSYRTRYIILDFVPQIANFFVFGVLRVSLTLEESSLPHFRS